MSDKPARYVVGIDLGTTHTVVGFVDTQRAHDDQGGMLTAQTRPRIQVFPVAQLVAPGEVAPRPLLPSFRYHFGEGELSDADRALGFPEPSPELPPGVVGALAQALGGKVAGRLVSSAKSWLCHAAVDRDAPILPWGAPEGVAKISPVAASQSYLAQVRAAWNAAHPKQPLETQEVVLTVPASFDEAARALTLSAAARAGLPKLRLLEEPQAAFYDWLDRHRDTLAADLSQVRLVLVVDVGGGTTDLTLVHVELRESGPRLTRIAVGEHLMLGGDNMDLTLARICEPAFIDKPGVDKPGERLPAARFTQLVEQCRGLKERLLAEDAPEQASVSLLGGGSRLIGGTKSTTLTRARVAELVVDGFMPFALLDDKLEQRRGGLLEFGLPYVADPAITKHVAQFLARHRAVSAEALGVDLQAAEQEPARVLPDAVLVNGGVFRAATLKQRLFEVLASLRGQRLSELDNDEPELAVARGAVAYGLARRGVGLRIGGGSPRSYYLLVETEGAGRTGVCILPRGAEEGEELVLKGQSFLLRVGVPVRFRLWATSADTQHRAGEVVELDERFHELPEIAVLLEAKTAERGELKVELHAGLTEVGTLEVSCVARDEPARRYKLELALRGSGAAQQAPARITQLHPRFAEATAQIHAFYGKSNKELEGNKIKTLRAELEKTLGPREGWDTALLRELFAALLAGKKRRRRSADHERVWLHLTGYALRPGFGYPLDDFRAGEVWELYQEGLQFSPDPQVWSQWWILWRRIAGGLDEARQRALWSDLSFYLEPPGPRPKARPKGPKALGFEDMVRLSGALERLPAADKVQAGEWLLARLDQATGAAKGSGTGEVSTGALWWALGRLGARAPLYGSAHSVVPSEVAARWLERALRCDLRNVDQAAFAAAQLARLTQDRQRDLAPALRERAALALERAGGQALWTRLVREGGALSEAEQVRVFGESLPHGLRLEQATP